MKQTEIIIPARCLTTLNINGMVGRLFSVGHKKPIKTKKSAEILLIYGHHSSLERMYTTALVFSSYGNVTMPDLPGFGGMDSFYKIGKTPSLENMADYLATFIKMHYKNKRFNIIGMSYGFLVVTKMLQKYPDIAKQTNLVFSLVGFSHKDDFKLTKRFYSNLLYGSKLGKTAIASFVLKYLVLNKPVITTAYNLNADKHVKLKDANKLERTKRINFEVYLWKVNDIRTYFFTTDEFLRVNLTNNKVNNILHHVHVLGDQYFDEQQVTKHLNQIYNQVVVHLAKLPNHAPTVVSDEQEAKKIVTPSLNKQLKLLK
jgi:pimeloyl-ACP methyl ester carboxylesterase